MWLEGADMKVGEVPGARSQWRDQSRQEGPVGRGFGRRRGLWSRGEAHAMEIAVARQMGDRSYAKSLALTRVGLEKPCIRQEVPVNLGVWTALHCTALHWTTTSTFSSPNRPGNLDVMHARRFLNVDYATCFILNGIEVLSCAARVST